MSSGYDAILFDFDGVLVDSEPLHWECWREVVSPYGLDLTWEDYARECIGVSDRKMIQALAEPEAEVASAAAPPAKSDAAALLTSLESH